MSAPPNLIDPTSSHLRTSFPLWTHLRQGRLLSHLKCFFLQLIHADATCALGFRVALGEIGLNTYRDSGPLTDAAG